MKEIKINVADKVASAIGSPVIVCGNSNYKITFIFDSEWGAYQEKTARFTFRRDGIDKYIDVLFSGSSCTAPILTNIERVSIGVYAGDLRTTTGADIRCKKSILCRGGLKHEQPTEDVYNEILETVSKKLGSEGGTVTGDYYKDGNTFIHEGNLELIDEHFSPTATANGKAITIDSANAPLQNLKLYGSTEQNGTPTPDAPVPLVSVGDSGSFEVGMYGKNLLDVTQGTKTSAGVTFTLNANKSYTLSGTCTNNVVHHIGKAYLVKGTQYKVTGCPTGGESKTYLIRVIGSNNTMIAEDIGGGKTFTATETGFHTIGIRVQQEINTNGLIFYPMVRFAIETDETYEPCNKQTLTMADTLRSVGDIKDEIDFIRGVRIQRCASVDLGTLTWSKRNEGYIETTGLGSKPQPPEQTYFLANMICSAYQVDTADNTWMGKTNNTISMTASENVIVRVRNNAITDYTTLSAQMSGIYLIYQLRTPIETPLTEQELNAYRHLMTNKGNTTVLSECEDTEITYYVNKPNAQAIGSLHEQINKDYFKLQQAIIETGGN